jgi:hypothetical protein
MGYGQDMSEERENPWPWVAGALAVVLAVAVYLWLTAPTNSILSETYTVM